MLDAAAPVLPVPTLQGSLGISVLGAGRLRCSPASCQEGEAGLRHNELDCVPGPGPVGGRKCFQCKHSVPLGGRARKASLRRPSTWALKLKFVSLGEWKGMAGGGTAWAQTQKWPWILPSRVCPDSGRRRIWGTPQARLWKAPSYHDRLMSRNGHEVVALGLSPVALTSGWS